MLVCFIIFVSLYIIIAIRLRSATDYRNATPTLLVGKKQTNIYALSGSNVDKCLSGIFSHKTVVSYKLRKKM